MQFLERCILTQCRLLSEIWGAPIMNNLSDIKQVLLVDDDTNITYLTQLALSELTDWKIEVASSGEEALKMIEKSAPDLILLDVMMPGMDGRTTFTKLRERPTLDATHIIF